MLVSAQKKLPEYFWHWSHDLKSFFFFFENFTEFDIMLVERPELSRKSQDSGKRLQTLVKAKSVSIKVPDYLGHWSRDTEIIFDFLEAFLQFLQNRSYEELNTTLKQLVCDKCQPKYYF